MQLEIPANQLSARQLVQRAKAKFPHSPSRAHGFFTEHYGNDRELFGFMDFMDGWLAVKPDLHLQEPDEVARVRKAFLSFYGLPDLDPEALSKSRGVKVEIRGERGQYVVAYSHLGQPGDKYRVYPDSQKLQPCHTNCVDGFRFVAE